MTVAAEIGWRLFLRKRLRVTPELRYWPNVYSSLPKAGVDFGDGAVHRSVEQGASGFFANVLVGWQFGL